MSEYVFLYRGETDIKTLSPQEAQQSMQKWMAWFKELEKKGKLKSIGQPLERSGKVGGTWSNARATPRKEEDGHRRSLRGDQGHHRRLLPHRGPQHRRSG